MRAHQLAPPDLGFAGRLRALAEAAARRAQAARIGNLAGLRWVPYQLYDALIENAKHEYED